MSADPKPVFVERRAYRRRRIVDAAGLLPLVGAVLVCLPLLWTGPRETPVPTTGAMIYFFGLWLALTVAAALLSRKLRGGDEAGTDDDGSDAGA